MNLSTEYRRQYNWRPWPQIFDALPDIQGQTVIDLGCSVGDQAAKLAARGAHVVGFDMNDELLREARSRGLENAEFHCCDLRTLPDVCVTADGIWSSFTAAYFPDLPTVLASWQQHLKPGGWIALTEIDDLFGHEPLSERPKAFLEAYARDAFSAGRYDFLMGRKLSAHLIESGFRVVKTLRLADQELSFDGPAAPEVLRAWHDRFERMALLRELCGSAFEHVRVGFLDCLARPDHRSIARVCFCMAIK